MINSTDYDYKNMNLTHLSLGEKCKIRELKSDGSIRRRFLDLGIIKGTEIEALSKSPSGDPVAYLIRGAVIAIRKEDAANIYIDIL